VFPETLEDEIAGVGLMVEGEGGDLEMGIIAGLRTYQTGR
jgi:hypothetical protein